MKRKLASTNFVLWCSRCKIHSYVAAPFILQDSPARPEKNRATQLNPANQKVALHPTKSWQRDLALDSPPRQSL